MLGRLVLLFPAVFVRDAVDPVACGSFAPLLLSTILILHARILRPAAIPSISQEHLVYPVITLDLRGMHLL